MKNVTEAELIVALERVMDQLSEGGQDRIARWFIDRYGGGSSRSSRAERALPSRRSRERAPANLGIFGSEPLDINGDLAEDAVDRLHDEIARERELEAHHNEIAGVFGPRR